MSEHSLRIGLIPTSFGLVMKGEDGLDDGGQAAGRAAGLPQDVPALERRGALFAECADLGVVAVEQLLAFAELAALLALVGGTDRAAAPT